MNKKLRDIIKSGNFTLYYSDNGCVSLYQGKLSQNAIESDEELNSIYDFDDQTFLGYAPEVVIELTKILGGKIHSV